MTLQRVSNNHLVYYLFAISLFGILIRIIYISKLNPSALLINDALDYHNIASNLFYGKGFLLNNQASAFRPPFYPFFLAGIYKIISNTTPMTAIFVQTIIAGLTIFLLGISTYSVTRSGFSACISAILLSLNPMHIYFSGQLQTETFFCFWFAAIIYTSVSFYRNNHLQKCFALGIILGLTALTRPTALVFVIPITILLIRLRPYFSSKPLLRIACFTMGLGITLSPWIIRNSFQFGRLTGITTNGGYNMVLGLSKSWTKSIHAEKYYVLEEVPAITIGELERDYDVRMTKLFYIEISKHPSKVLNLFLKKWIHFFSPLLSEPYSTLQRAIALFSYCPLLIGTLAWPFLKKKDYTDYDVIYLYKWLLFTVLIFSLSHILYITNIRLRVPVADVVFTIFSADSLRIGLTRTFKVKENTNIA